MRGILLLNAIMVPLALLGIYLAYVGKKQTSVTLLTLGVAVVVASPLISYIVAARALRTCAEKRR
ncbi:MAG: hypothetical protein ABWW70_06470 [Thermoproteota archaeon]